MTSIPFQLAVLARMFAIAALFSCAPVAVTFGSESFAVAPLAAFAKSGPGKSGDEDRDDDRRADRDRDDDDRDDDRDDDVRGGRDDDSRSGGDDSAPSGTGPAASSLTQVQLTSSGIVLIYRDGSREILADGWIRRLDRAGRVVERRRATAADLVHFRALADRNGAVSVDPQPAVPDGQPARITLRGRDVTVLYSNGWTEAVDGGRYRLTDRYGRRVVDRKATAADRSRLMALTGR